MIVNPMISCQNLTHLWIFNFCKFSPIESMVRFFARSSQIQCSNYWKWLTIVIELQKVRLRANIVVRCRLHSVRPPDVLRLATWYLTYNPWKSWKLHVMTSALRLASVTSNRLIVLTLRIIVVYAIALSPSHRIDSDEVNLQYSVSSTDENKMMKRTEIGEWIPYRAF